MLLLVAVTGCKDREATRSEPPPLPTLKIAGVYPDKWQCDSVATLAALEQVLGGPVTQREATAALPPGLPQPCNYEVQASGLELWTFDLDCRDGMKQRADALFAQYQATSQELVEQYARLRDAGAGKPSDAGPPPHPPEPAAEVAVGARGLDHHGQGLLFIDDDAPCYVRVVGKDAARRHALARLIAKNLTFENAPMVPRAAR